jgi:hypothetical protein
VVLARNPMRVKFGATRRSPFAVHRSPFAVRRSPFAGFGVSGSEFGVPGLLTPEFCLLDH